MADGSLIYDTKLNSDGFKKGIDGLKSIAKGGAAVVGGVVTAFATASGAALKFAGDLEQNVGGAESVFKDLGKAIKDMSAPMQQYNATTKEIEKTTTSLEQVSKQAYKNMGLSQSEYLATVNKMGALMKGTGMDTQTSLNLSVEAMQRAADIASIMGIETSFAMESIAGAAKGNFTMMDNLGVAMNDTALNAYALEKGIGKTTREMSTQEKVGLAMEMFLEKTTYAAGNYAKENETLAGSLGTAKAALVNFLSGAGDFEAVFDSLSNVADVSGRMVKDIISRLSAELTANSGKIGDAIGSAFTAAANEAPGILNASFAIINALLDSLSNSADQIGTGIQNLLYNTLSNISITIPKLTNVAVSLVNALIPDDPSIFASSLTNLLVSIATSLEALVTGIDWGTAAGAIIGGLIAGIVNALPDVIFALSNAVLGLDFSGFATSLASAFDGIDWASLGKRLALALANGLLSGLTTMLGGKNSIAGKILSPLIESINEKNDELKRAGQQNASSYAKGFTTSASSQDFSSAMTVGINKGTPAATRLSEIVGQQNALLYGGVFTQTASSQDFSSAMTSGINKGTPAASTASSEAGTLSANAFNESASKVFGATSFEVPVVKMVSDGGKQAKQTADTSGNDVGSSFVEGTTTGITDNTETVSKAGGDMVSKGLEGAKAVQDGKGGAKDLGGDFTKGYAAGIKAQGQQAYDAGYYVAQQAKKGTQDGQDSSSPSKEAAKLGRDFDLGYVKGIKDNADIAGDAASNLATDALKAVQETQDSHSAAKETIKLGEDFADGFTVGIKNGTEKAVDAADNMVLDALDSLNNLSSERAMEKLRAEGKLVGKGDIDQYIATHPEALYDETLFGLPGIKSSRGLNMMDIKNGYWADITAEQLSITQEMYDTVVAWLKEFPEAIGKEVSFRYTNNRQTGEREVLDALVGNNGFIVQIMNDALASSRLIEVPSPVYMQGAFPELRKLYEYMARSEMFFSGDYVTHLEDVLPDDAANIQVTYFTEGSKRNTAALFNPIQWLDGTVFDAAWKENSRSTDKGELQRQQDDAQAAELRSLKHHLAMEKITQKEYYDALKAFRDKYYSVDTAEYERYTEELFQMDKDFLRESQDLELRNLNHSLNMGKISEKEYYSALEKFRDKYYVKDSAEWQQYTEEIHQFRLRENEEFEGNILKGLQHMRSMGKLTEEEYYAALAKYRDQYIKKGSDQWRQYTTEIYNYYQQAMDKILTDYQQQYTGINNRLNEAINKSVTKITIKSGKYGVEEYYKLADNSKYIKQLDEYTKLLTDIREKRGDLPSEVQNTLKSLDVENGIIFAKEILNASDKDWDTYIKSFSEVSEKSARIASDLTQNDLETAMKLLGEKYKEIPEQFFSIGNSSAENFASAFLLSIDPLALMIKKKISDSMLASVVYGPGIGADGRGFNSGSTFNNSYNFYSSADTTTQQLDAAADKAVMDRLRWGGGN